MIFILGLQKAILSEENHNNLLQSSFEHIGLRKFGLALNLIFF